LGDGLYEHPCLKTLKLAHNNILAKPACVILSAVKDCESLTEVDLSDNPIGEEGARSLLALNLTHGNRVKVDIRNCTLKLKDPTCWFQMHNPRGTYELDLARPYERAICIELLRIVARDKDLEFSNLKFIAPEDSSGAGSDLSLKLFEEKRNDTPGLARGESFIIRRSISTVGRISSTGSQSISPRSLGGVKSHNLSRTNSYAEPTQDEFGANNELEVNSTKLSPSGSAPQSPKSIYPRSSAVSSPSSSKKIPNSNHQNKDDDETYIRETFREAANRIFQQYDRDQSGTLDKAEVAHILEQLGLEGSWALVDKLVAMYDSDGSGCIEENEFVSFLMDVKKSYEKESNLLFANRYFYLGNENMVHGKGPKAYLPPSHGRMKLVVDGQSSNGDVGNEVISTAQIQSLLDAGKTICESSALFEFALDASTWTINEARTFFKAMVRELGSVLQVMMKLLPRMATPLDVRMLIAYVTNHDFQQIQHLKLALGPLFRILIGIPNGFYQLSLNDPNDRKAIHLLMQLSHKHNQERKKMHLGDTSQMGNWSSFRNVILDGQATILNEESFLDEKKIPDKGKLDFDFVLIESVSMKEVEISNLRLFRVVQALGMVDSSKRKRIFQRLDYQRDEGRQVAKGYGNRKWEIGHNAASNIAERLESFYDVESLQNRVAAPYIVPPTKEETSVLEDKKKLKGAISFKANQSGKPGPRQSQSRGSQLSSAKPISRAPSTSVESPKHSAASLFQAPDTPQDVGGVMSRPGSSAVIGNELRTIDIYGQHIKEMLEHPAASSDPAFIAMRVIDALEMILAGRYLTCAQLSLIVERLPGGELRLHDLATYRVELIVSLFSRIKDLINFDFVLKDLESTEIAMLIFRLGWLNTWNPLKAEGDVCLNLARREERQMAKMLVCLNFLEHGSNWLHPSFHETREEHLAYRATHPVRSFVDEMEEVEKKDNEKALLEADTRESKTHNDEDHSWSMPSAWLVEATFPQHGILALQYFSGKGVQFNGASPNVPIRMALMPFVLPSPYEEDLRHPSEFTVEHSDSVLQKLGVKFSLHTLTGSSCAAGAK
jgi:hypothetical protein